MFSAGIMGSIQSPPPVVAGSSSMATVGTNAFGSATYFNGMYIIFPGSQSRNTYYTSTNGTSWTSRTLPITELWGNVSTLSNLLLITAGFLTSSVYTSTDGLSWTARTLPVSGYFWNFVQTSAGTIIGRSGNGLHRLVVSNDNGATWTSATHPTGYDSKLVSDGQNAYLFSSVNERIYKSVNGTTWQNINPSPPSVSDSYIVFVGNHIIAKEINRIFFTVPDSRNLIRETWGRYPSDLDLHRISYDPITKIYVASTLSENVLYFSRNLEDWEAKTFGAVNSHRTYDALVAYNGKAITAPLQETTSPTPFSSRIYTLQYS